MKWYFHNAKARSALAMRKRGYVLNAVARGLTFTDERFLARVSGTDALRMRKFLQEPFEEFASAVSSPASRIARGIGRMKK